MLARIPVDSLVNPNYNHNHFVRRPWRLMVKYILNAWWITAGACVLLATNALALIELVVTDKLPWNQTEQKWKQPSRKLVQSTLSIELPQSSRACTEILMRKARAWRLSPHTWEHGLFATIQQSRQVCVQTIRSTRDLITGDL